MQRRSNIVTQDAFNAAVMSYVENFGLNHVDACKEAVEEFEIQDFDISQVNTHILPTDIERGKFLETVSEVHVIQEEGGSVAEFCWGPPQANNPRKPSESVGIVALSHSNEEFIDDMTKTQERNLYELLRVCQSTHTSTEDQTKTLQALAELISRQSVKSILLECQHFKDFLSFFANCGISASYCHFLSVAVAGHSDLKDMLLKERVHIALGEAIEKGEPRTARSACRTLISVLVDDDKKVLTNLTSHRVQVLLDDGLLEIIGNYISICIQCDMQTCLREPVELLSRMLVSERVCCSIGIGLLKDVVDAVKCTEEIELLTLLCKCLRRLALSDTCKRTLLLHNVVGILSCLLSKQVKLLLEQVIGTLAALTLRSPQTSIEFQNTGGIEAVLRIMQECNSGRVQRQCCILVRNICMKNKKIQEYMLSKNAVELIQNLKNKHSACCNDVGSAALRDLGCEDYNTGWSPKTLVLGETGIVHISDEL